MIHGFIVVDKPAGITSHDVVSRVRRIMGTRSVGHTGTLDPFATGVLPVAVNDATKLIPYLDEGTKGYQALMRLGVTTDTLDMTGTVLGQSDPGSVTVDALLNCFSRCTGTVEQIPPMYSAIKIAGQPLYKLARKGENIERQPRQIEIHTLELISCELPLVAFSLSCSRGTYVRSLADDIGTMLGCGAALQELRRTFSGPFRQEQSVTLEQLEAAAANGTLAQVMISPSAAISHLPTGELDSAAVDRIRHGQALSVQHLLNQDAVCEGLMQLQYHGDLVSVAEAVRLDSGAFRIQPKRVFVA